MAFISCGTQKKAQDQSQEINVTSEENAQTTEEVAPTDQKEGEYKVHVVQKGETLSIIAGRYKVTVEAIVKLNNITNPDLIKIGQELLIPKAEDNL